MLNIVKAPYKCSNLHFFFTFIFIYPEQPHKSPMQRQVERYRYPPPAPPTQRKKEVFNLNRLQTTRQGCIQGNTY